MKENLIVTIFKGAQLALSAAPVAIETYLALKRLLGSEFTVTAQAIDAGTIKTAEETIAIVDEWKRQNLPYPL